MRKLQLAVIATHPIQYQAPVWRGLGRTPEIGVHVYYGSDFSIRGYRDDGFGVNVKWDVPLLDGYPHTFLSTDIRIQGMNGFLSLRASGLKNYLRELRPDCALICGYMPFFWWEAAWVVHKMKVPLLLRTEATDVAKSRGPIRGALRRLFLRAFYRRCDYFLAIGKNARDHYLSNGIPADRIGWSPYCTDSELMERQIHEFGPQRVVLRRSMGFTQDQTVFIYSAKLIAKKDPMTLARAFLRMDEKERGSVGLIVLGDGEMRGQFERASREALGDRAVFVGFVNQRSIGRYYAAADCLVLPSVSEETWGVVVNEVLQFGLPAIVSDRVGSHPDLIVEGETGWVFPAGDADNLRMCLLRLARMDPERRRALSQGCRQRISEYSTEEAVRGLRDAVTRVCRRSPRWG